MGFTIGISRGMRDIRPGSRRRRASDGTAVAEYTGLWGWDVVPSDVRPRRREPARMSRMPRLMPIVKPMPPPTGPAHRWLRSGRVT
jgi:hypothetical protein